MSLLLVVLSLLICLVWPISAQLDCSNTSIVSVSTENVDNLAFNDFPDDTPIPTDDYNPGAIGPWYDIASGIINVVRPGSFSRSVVVPLIDELNINFTSLGSVSVSNEQLQELGRDLATWWAGIIALTILGLLLGISMLVCCCCFGLCRCCGKCGGDLKQEEKSSTNCLTIVFTIILVLLICWLIAGIVLAFFSGQQMFESVNEFEETANNTFDLSEIFINDSVDKVEILLCSVEETFDLTVGQANGLIDDANGVVNSFSGQIYDIVDQVLDVSRDIEALQGTLSSVNTSVNDLQANTTSINGSLQTIGDSAASAFDNCTALNNLPTVTLNCDPLNPDTFRNGLGANYFEVPDVGSELTNVQNIVSGINLTDTALEGNRTYNSAVQEISNLTKNIDQVIEDGLDTLRDVTGSASTTIRNFTNSAVGSDGYIGDARSQTQSGFDFVRQYETPRYAVGVVISCLAISVVVLVLLGVCCGLIGYRTDRAPYERTDISNCGGIMLICAAFVAFLIGFFVLVLSAVLFFFGGVATKFCGDFAPPEYEFLAQTVDNPQVTSGKYLLSDALFNDGSIELTISGILRDCSDNSTVYQALKLENLDFIKDIQNFTNISRLIPEVSLNVSSLTDSITGVFDINTFVPSDLQTRLDDFTTAGVNAINITQFREQLNKNILAFNTTMQIEELQALRSDLQAANLGGDMNAEAQRDSIVASINTTIDELRSIDSTVSSLNGIVGTLDSNVRSLEDNADLLTTSAGNLLTNINTTFNDLVENGVDPLVENASAVFPRAIGYAQQFVDFGLNALQNEVGNCRPIAAIYSEFYDAFCSFTVDSLNGFWLSLGMVGVLMIPIIIFSVVTSHYYRRMKYGDGEELPYEDSFPMKTY